MVRLAPTNWNPLCKTRSLSERETHKLWLAIRDRCINPRCKEYKNYGAKGARLHGDWFEFTVFLVAVGPRPSVFHTLRRIDRDGDYAPGNVKWMTKRELHELRQTPAEAALIQRDRFMRSGSFDWDAWRAAGSPE